MKARAATDNDDPPTDEEICRLDGIQLSGPTVLGVKEAGLYRLSISPCVREILSSVTWTIDSLQDSSGEGKESDIRATW